MKLCKCNNCGNIWEDMNPQVNAIEYPDNPAVEPLVIVEEYEEFDHDRYIKIWGCPVCRTDNYLTDYICERRITNQ